MHEASERLVAELLVIPRVQDQFMPQIIRNLRGHGNEFAAAFQVGQEKLAQRMRSELAIFEG